MKNIIALFLTLVFCFFTMSCNNEPIENNEISTTESGAKSYGETSLSAALENKTIISQESNAFEENSLDSGEWGGELLPRKYRNNYYQIPLFFAEIVGEDVCIAWEKVYFADKYPDDTNEMVMLAFIKEFNISKEDFEKANLEYAKFIEEHYSHICLDPQDYADQEMQEIYNTEIIYTFDNEIINEYYLGIDYPFLNEYQYVEALEAGTYTTRTTEFVNVEQMEADIIAKYGEAEIVTEAVEETASAAEESTEAVSLPEETAV